MVLRGWESYGCGKASRRWSMERFSGVTQTAIRHLCTPGWKPIQVTDCTLVNSSPLTCVNILKLAPDQLVRVPKPAKRSVFGVWPSCLEINGKVVTLPTLHTSSIPGTTLVCAVSIVFCPYRSRQLNSYYITTHSQTPIVCIVSREDKRYI